MSHIDSPPTLSPREVRKNQKHYQKRLKEIAQVWIKWLDFLKDFEKATESYRRKIYGIVARISGERAYEKNAHDVKLAWDTARDRILSLEVLQTIAEEFDVSHNRIMSDVGKIASHASWMSGVYRRGEGGILYDVQKSMGGVEVNPPPI